ncbi:cytochrome b/b6 domain-containing protein [Leucobacter denitrificans]|uniref:cytochrome b/b6 domain-containing protein n=1 Tax=Leucobacter denitrificans TaxID=683042 RepID=UPI001FE39F78|nr:cytochrome b/b6 domain-containing protein [Leucobacter denitrificans]
MNVVPDTAEVSVAVSEPSAQPAGEADAGSDVSSSQVLRQGLPRTTGGDPWPQGGVVAGSAAMNAVVTPPIPDPGVSTKATVELEADSAPAPIPPQVDGNVTADSRESVADFVAGDVALRRGLPRVMGGRPWPPEGFAPASSAPKATRPVATPQQEAPPAVEQPPAAAPPPSAPQLAPTARAGEPVAVPQAAPAAPAARQGLAASTAAESPVQSKPTPVVEKPVKPKREPTMIGEKSLAQWVKLVVLGGIGAIIVAGVLVLAARGVTTLPGVPAWLEKYPGEYDLPESSEPGFPWWARWSHALNIFLIVLIIRSGLLVRTQQKPPAFWTPNKGGKKISINLWLHTSLDVLWLVNGVLFVVLLFVSGHWMRVIPTSWEVFPNALSALLQYMTLDWPTENGWVNYNSLQQIMYFVIIFVAAPLAAITGLRMSEWWPKNAEKLNKFYPAPLARALHFPTMLFFVFFIIVHVFLVFSTGALKNLNHMFTGTEAVNWTGFWLFALTIFVTVAGWFAARPLIMAPIANVFGKVSNR